MKSANQPINIIVVEKGQWTQEQTEVIVETAVSLTVNGESWLTFMCTPVHLEAMAVGFLFNEGIIQTKEEIADVRLCPEGDNVDVWLHHQADKPEKWRRTSGCTGGVTSIQSEIERAYPNPQALADGAPLRPEQISDLIGQLFEAQDLYRRSGGVHTSALSDGQRILVTAEDIGRHNSLDKIAGRCLLENIDAPRRILLTTGRISSEMLQKSARLGASLVVSRTSPSSISVRMAERWGITLIGYARRTGFRIYAHPERIIRPDGANLKSNLQGKISNPKKNGNPIHETQ